MNKIKHKNIHIHPFCDFFIRCELMENKFNWYIVYKHPLNGLRPVSRDQAKEIIDEERKFWEIIEND